MALAIIDCDYHAPHHAAVLVTLLDAYARDPAAGGTPLAPTVRELLVGRLAARPDAFSVLAFDGDTPVGLVNCFEGFSTFKARPLVNIHDVVVLAGHRRRGIAAKMIARVAEIARDRGCCKLTLEVLEGNAPARALYDRLGFGAYELDPQDGHALFWEMELD